MLLLMAVATGLFYAVGIYLILRRSLVKIVLGLALLSTAANLLIFVASRPVRGRPPIVPSGAENLPAPHSDPVPQALILTAIVIAFAALAFVTVLARRAWRTQDLDDLDEMRDES